MAGFAFVVSAIAGVATFFAVLVQSSRQTPGWEGLLSGTILGFVTGIMVIGMGVGLATMLISIDPAPPELNDGTAEAMAPVLRALETTRLDIVRQVRKRALWRVPLGVVGGIAIWALDRDAQGLFGLAMNVGVGGLAGEFWAAHALGERYRRLYKDRVLPRLAARFGAITYRAARQPDLGKLCDEGIFREYDKVIAEDELVGIYRGLAVSIVELRLELGSGKNRKMVFNGLLAEVELPRRLQGDTAVLPNAGAFGGFHDWIGKTGRERVRLEDPRFEAVYDVWATDQITARALLTPPFLERFMTLAESPGFGLPVALACDHRLLIVLPSRGRNLFEPPSYRRPAAGQAALAELERDIAAVLAIVDAVIDLDYAARAVSANHSDGLRIAADRS